MACPLQGRKGHEEEVRSEPPDPDPWETQTETPKGTPATLTPPIPETPEVLVDPKVAEANALNVLVQEKFRKAVEEGKLPPPEREQITPYVPKTQPTGTEKLVNPEPVTVGVAATAAAPPLVQEMQGLLEGAFQAGAAVPQPTGVGLSSGALAQALAQVATTSVAKVNSLALNEQMGLMEQTLVEQFSVGQMVQSLPAAEAPALAKTYPAGVPQAGVAPTQQSIVAKSQSKIVQEPVTSILPYQGFIVQAMMELAFGAASKALTPSAATVIKQAESVVQKTPVVQTIKEFGSFVGSLLP